MTRFFPVPPRRISADAVLSRGCRLQLFRTRLAAALRGRFAEDEAFGKDILMPVINEGLPVEELFGTQEAELVLNEMQERNEIFYSEGTIYRV